MRHTSRRTLLATVATALAGCRGGSDETPTATPQSGSNNPALGDLEQVGELGLASPAFEDGGTIPQKYGRGEENVNPPLAIENVPDGAESLTLILDDPDAVEPAGTVWLHWLVWNIPPSRAEIPEGWEPTGAVEGSNDFGERGYGGPDPPDGEHTYRFKLYALDATLDLTESADKRDVGRAMQDSRLAQTQLAGTYTS